jgi:hypothetical protein
MTVFRRIALTALLFAVYSCLSGVASDSTISKIRPGDIVFQDLETLQSKAIKLATHSEFTHCGVVFKKDGNLVVYEAVQPVTVTALRDWIDRGVNHYVVVKRLIGADSLLDPGALDSMQLVANGYLGRDYDIYFAWSDEQMYCSELVWKVYERGLGVELTDLRPMKDFDLSHPVVQAIMAERYGEDVPLDHPMVSPGDLFEAAKLEEVYVTPSDTIPPAPPELE